MRRLWITMMMTAAVVATAGSAALAQGPPTGGPPPRIAAALGLTGAEQALIPTLGTGQGLWRIKSRSFVVQHQMHPAELELFDTSARAAGR